MLVLLLLLGRCGSSSVSEDEADSSDDEAVTQTEEADEEEAVDEATEDEEAVDEADEEEADADDTTDLSTLEGTEAAAFVAEMYAGMLEDDSAQAPDPADDGAVRTYEVSTGSYALTVQASAQTDEISYVRFEVLAWDEDVNGINLLMMIYRLLELDDAYGVSYVDWYGFVSDYTDGEGTVTGESEEDFGLEGVSFTLWASADGLPVLEVTAR